MKAWLLQVVAFVAFAIDVLVGGALIYSYLGTVTSIVFVLILAAGYVGVVLGPLAATTYDRQR